MISELMDSFWYKEKEVISLDCMGSEEKKLFQFLENFKNGIFDEKEKFVNFFTNATDREIYVMGMRIFMSIARHEDISLLEDFLGECDEEHLSVFLAFVEESLSCHTIPYLLALLDTWEETEVAQDIADIICDMLQYESMDEEEYDTEELGKAYVQFCNTHDLDKYYYCGNEMFLGDLTKEMMLVTMECKSQNETFYTDQIPSILSNSTGIGCPVSYGVEITDNIVGQVMEYIEKIAKLGQKRGHKYFYNNLIG
ncbi:MAG: hypothetical protein K2N44_18430 [Lachnospiraceae bacterium]|nr:hypothetical protein [Lachnospiraceae bacterium]